MFERVETRFTLLVAQDVEHVAGRTIEIHLTSANQVLPTIEYDNEVQMGTKDGATTRIQGHC